MRSKWLKRAGIVAFSLIVLNSWLSVIFALREGHMVIGFNYWNAPLFTWLTLVILVICTPVGIYHAVRNWN